MENIVQIDGKDYIMASVFAMSRGKSRQYVAGRIKVGKIPGAKLVSGYWWVPLGSRLEPRRKSILTPEPAPTLTPIPGPTLKPTPTGFLQLW